jgi:hypothetical protein
MGGIAGVGGWFLVSALRHSSGVGELIRALLLGLLLLGSLTGITAITALLGQGALELAERRGSRALAVGLGSVLLGLLVLIPFVGWILGAYFLLIGLGGTVEALVWSRRRQKTV